MKNFKPFEQSERIAFTLAEVLITLGIIGVVAALTIPSLVAKHKEKVVATKVKTFYSQFSQAYLMAINDNGTIDNWGLKNTINVTDDNGDTVRTDDGIETVERFFDVLEPYLKKVLRNKVAKNLKDETDTYVLANGIIITAVHYGGYCDVSNENSYCGDFYIKTDSSSIYNKNFAFNDNVFAFILSPHKIIPYGFTDAQFEKCKNRTNNSRCTAWILYNGNMDYLRCPDDLSWQGEHKCK